MFVAGQGIKLLAQIFNGRMLDAGGHDMTLVRKRTAGLREWPWNRSPCRNW